jgi:hypothetical protein
MKKKKFVNPTQKGFPDGEGFNALPIAFVYVIRAERNVVQSMRNCPNRFDCAPRRTFVAPLSAKK